jgi:hypothetical protein
MSFARRDVFLNEPERVERVSKAAQAVLRRGPAEVAHVGVFKDGRSIPLDFNVMRIDETVDLTEAWIAAGADKVIIQRRVAEAE